MNSIENQIYRDIKVLIIEDDVICAEVLKHLLQSLGFTNITLAKNGKQAIELFHVSYGFIITDFRLPDMTGVEITQHYRKIFPKKDTPIICCSSEIEKHRRECIEAEINDFLPKPTTLEDIKDILECWFVHRIGGKK